MLLGIDTGGTFTDFVLFDGVAKITIHKALSTPQAPEQAILQGMAELGLSMKDLRIIHGSTVATNAVLEGKGARTAFITNRGLRDMLTIGRQARRELYNLQPEVIPPPVPEDYCLETGGRLDVHGDVVEPLTEADLADLRARIDKLDPEAVAINLLFSYLDDTFEKQISAVMPGHVFITRSSAILPEQREYERGIAAWLNAYVSPRMQGYLVRLSQQVKPAKLSVMRSTGQTCGAEQAGQEAVHLLFSGPAGGLNGIRYIGEQCNLPRLMTFDMGGTSTDVALLDGQIRLNSKGSIAGYPVTVPMVDMHTIGAGGGSIARVDRGGALLVGPESAGADPGPACYARGGENPTITDANLVLGRLPSFTRLGGAMALDMECARASLESLVEPLSLDSVEAVAEGIIRVANEHMIQALRQISVQRGIDPRQFTLAAFGGAGGLHVCALADALEITQGLAPVHAGVLSALGMLVAAPGRQLSRTVGVLVSECTHSMIDSLLNNLATKARESLKAENVSTAGLEYTPTLDLCYRGQGFTLNVPWESSARSEALFHQLHQDLYGHRLDSPVELVNVRLGVNGSSPVIELQGQGVSTGQADHDPVTVYGVDKPVTVSWRQQLATGKWHKGPAILMDDVSTLYIEPGWEYWQDPVGNMILKKSPDLT